MTKYLLTSNDYTAVVGYAECAGGYDQHGRYAPQVTGYFGRDNARPEDVSAPAYAVAEVDRRGWPIPPAAATGQASAA